MLENRSQNFLIHLSAAMIFLLSPFLFSPGPMSTNRVLMDEHVQRDIMSSVLMLIFFYTNYFYLIPNFFFNKKYLYFGISAILFLLLITILPPIIFPFVHDGGPHPPPPPRSLFSFHFLIFEMGHQFFMFSATLLLSLTIRINARWRKTEKEKLNAELSYLKAQINPHFLFNTLNSIYSLSIIKSDKAPEAVVKLSGMMRYVLSESHNERVPLEKEIAYISNYIELQQIRLVDTVKLDYAINGNLFAKAVAPLILITFVENAFKHGVNAEENSEIKIIIETDDDTITLEVVNNKVRSIISIEESSGLGIENTKNRLNLLYPHKHDLQILDDGHVFSVILKINIK